MSQIQGGMHTFTLAVNIYFRHSVCACGFNHTDFTVDQKCALMVTFLGLTYSVCCRPHMIETCFVVARQLVLSIIVIKMCCMKEPVNRSVVYR